METKYNEEQSKWATLCDRVNQQIDKHQLVYHEKFPVDPYSRDIEFQDTVNVQKEIQQAMSYG